jgi:hypothetical protein
MATKPSPKKLPAAATARSPQRPGRKEPRLTGQVGVDGGCSGLERRVLTEMGSYAYPTREETRKWKYWIPFGWPSDRIRPGLLRGVCQAKWNSVLLFFNLAQSIARPSDYVDTNVADALAFLDQGPNPAAMPISDFMRNYWCALSYGKLAFGIDTPRDANGQPIIATLAPVDAQDWPGCIRLFVQANGADIWRAAGSLLLDGQRWIPSVVLVQRHYGQLQAHFGTHMVTSAGVSYIVGDEHRMHYNLAWAAPAGGGAGTASSGRMIWGRMCHEYAHNFLEFGDLYQGAGCTGYWDLFGDNSPAGRMSEVCSYMKQRKGWLDFKRELRRIVQLHAPGQTDAELQRIADDAADFVDACVAQGAPGSAARHDHDGAKPQQPRLPGVEG